MARLQYAEARLAEVVKLSERDQLLARFYKAEHARVAHVHATAAKDNATVYLERVPPLAQLLATSPTTSCRSPGPCLNTHSPSPFF